MPVAAAQPDTLPANLIQEFRRGTIVLAVLAQLRSEEYGYSLKQALADAGLPVEEGTLYPLMRRLEAQGLLESRWVVAENRPRRYYRISAEGERTLAALSQEWKVMSAAIRRLKP
jgi:DNA-binding PadR family transcriptional regulator